MLWRLCSVNLSPLPMSMLAKPAPSREVPKGRRKRKVYASQVQLRALRKGPLTSKLARASPRLPFLNEQQSEDCYPPGSAHLREGIPEGFC
eukprot:1160691-Pelagomonas_calceolata.AAC.6